MGKLFYNSSSSLFFYITAAIKKNVFNNFIEQKKI